MQTSINRFLLSVDLLWLRSSKSSTGSTDEVFKWKYQMSFWAKAEGYRVLKQESSRKTSLSVLLTMPKPLSAWITINWKVLKEMGIPDHLTYLLRNLYAGQEATDRTGHGTTDWFQIGKGVRQGCILSPCLFNLYAEYIMRNAGLEEAQGGVKIARRNINNLRYADDTTLLAESEEELNSLLMKMKEESEKVGLKLNIYKTKIMTSGPITSWQIDGETVADFIFGAPKSLQMATAAMK
uniref:RNA-directed DNA polymerase n=1 Tax=Bos mutus grunniens TaxID=30521 RepID=A0A8B9XBS3_BOSMU